MDKLLSKLVCLSKPVKITDNNKYTPLVSYGINYGQLLMCKPLALPNGTEHFKNMNNCLNTNIFSYMETSGGQSSNPHLNALIF
jgi:hypothetical protein